MYLVERVKCKNQATYDIYQNCASTDTKSQTPEHARLRNGKENITKAPIDSECDIRLAQISDGRGE